MIAAVAAIVIAQACAPGPNCSTGQNGGLSVETAVVSSPETAVVRTPQRHLTEVNKNALLANLPKGRTINVVVPPGDGEALTFADEIVGFPRFRGYDVEGPNGVTLSGQNESPRGVDADMNAAQPNDPVQITVGVSAPVSTP